MVRWEICYDLYKLKNFKKIHGWVLLLVKLQAEACNFTKSKLLHGYFSRFLNCTNGIKSHKASHSIIFLGHSQDLQLRRVSYRQSIVILQMTELFSCKIFHGQTSMWYYLTWALRETSPNPEFFLVGIQSKWRKIRIRKKLGIWTLFAQWGLTLIFFHSFYGIILAEPCTVFLSIQPLLLDSLRLWK